MTKRKTIEVETILNDTNAFLARRDDYVTADMRIGAALVLERILHATGRYAGFNYLGWTVEKGYERWVADGRPENRGDYIGDVSRRVYYLGSGPTPKRTVAAEPSYDYPNAL